MKKQIIIPIIFVSLFLIVLTSSNVSAVYINSSYCGDGICNGYESSNSIADFYCPQDCGYPGYPRNNDTDCPVCNCPSYSNSNPSGSGSNGGSCSSVCPFPFVEKVALIKFTGNKCKDGLILIGIVLFLVGGLLGYSIKKKRGKKRR